MNQVHHNAMKCAMFKVLQVYGQSISNTKVDNLKTPKTLLNWLSIEFVVSMRVCGKFLISNCFPSTLHLDIIFGIRGFVAIH